MKVGDAVYIENLRYEISHVKLPSVTLKRKPTMTLAQFRKLRKARRWVRLVSANFIIDKKTRVTLTNYELLALGISVNEINRLQETLPIDEVNDAI